jgi:protease PrsW
MTWLALAVAVIPPSIAVIYFATHTSDDPKPGVVLVAFLLGILTILAIDPAQSELASIVEYGRNTYQNAFVVSFLEAALVEETAKYLVVVALWWTVCRFRGPWEGLVIGATVSLGYATAENVWYGAQQGFTSVADRAVWTPLSHAFDGAVMGLMLVFARRYPVRRIHFFIAALALPVLLHGAYDFPIFLVDKPKWMSPGFDTTVQVGLILFNFAVVLSSFEIARRLYRRLAEQTPRGRV